MAKQRIAELEQTIVSLKKENELSSIELVEGGLLRFMVPLTHISAFESIIASRELTKTQQLL